MRGFFRLEPSVFCRLSIAVLASALVSSLNEPTVRLQISDTEAMKAAGKDMTGQELESADPNAFNQQRAAALKAAQQEAAGQRVALERETNEKIIAMQNEAVTAGMRGEALYDRQRQDAIDAVTRKYQQHEYTKQQALQMTEAIDVKFHNEKMKRLEDEQYETLRLQQAADQAGLTGIAKLQAEGQNKQQDLTENPANAGLDAQTVAQRRVVYEQETDTQIVAERDKFQQQL